MSTTKEDVKKSGKNARELPISEEKLKELFRQMLTIRRFEEKVGQQYQLKKFSGFCHLYIGQEAVLVGATAATELGKDYAFTTYRNHGHALVYGIPPKEIMAELFMRATGCSKGKGGSMHFYNAKNHYMGGNGIVGGHTPLATGVAFASKYRKDGAVTLCYMGDAAVNQGTFHESLNMAGLWKLPCIYIAENNIYGMGTSIERSCAEPELYKRTEGAYRIPGVRVNGMDVLEVYTAMKDAVERARNGDGPTFIEMICYRYRGHSMSDPATSYRNKSEVSDWQAKDPIDRLKIEYPDLFPEAEVKALGAEIKGIIAEAIEYAEESPYPEQSEIWTHVYADYPGYPKPDVNPNKYAFPYEGIS